MIGKLMALLLLGVLIFGCIAGYTPGVKDTLKERDARMYWSAMYPVSIKDYSISTQGATFTIKNIGDSKIIIDEINIDGMGGRIYPSNHTLLQGDSKEFTQPNIRCSKAGEQYELGISSIIIKYSEIGSLQWIETGEKALVGVCAS